MVRQGSTSLAKASHKVTLSPGYRSQGGPIHSIIQKPFFCPRLGFASPIAKSRTAHCLAIALCFFNPAELSGCSGFRHKVALGKQLSPPCRGSWLSRAHAGQGFLLLPLQAQPLRPDLGLSREQKPLPSNYRPTASPSAQVPARSVGSLGFRHAASPAAPQPGDQSHRFLPGLSPHTLRDLRCPPLTHIPWAMGQHPVTGHRALPACGCCPPPVAALADDAAPAGDSAPHQGHPSSLPHRGTLALMISNSLGGIFIILFIFFFYMHAPQHVSLPWRR